MTRTRILLVGAAWLGLLAFAGYEFRAVAHLRAAHAAATAELRRLRTEADLLRRSQAATAAEIALAEQQLSALTVVGVPDPAAARQVEIAAWVERTKRLRQHFAEKPELAIPEMRLLTDDDWLRVTKNANLDTEKGTRLALAEIRASASKLFTLQLVRALHAYTQAFPNQKPVNVHALATFFAQAPDSAILERYELQDPSGPTGFGPAKWFAQNKAPIDLAYDSRFRVSAESSFQNSGASAWVPDYQERYRRAAHDYAKANSGQRPPGLAGAIPFFSPPLPTDVAAALIQSEERK